MSHTDSTVIRTTYFMGGNWTLALSSLSLWSTFSNTSPWSMSSAVPLTCMATLRSGSWMPIATRGSCARFSRVLRPNMSAK